MGGLEAFVGPGNHGCSFFSSLVDCFRGLVMDCNALARMDGSVSQALLEFGGGESSGGGAYGGYADDGVGGAALGAASHVLKCSDVVGVGGGGLEDGGGLLSSRAPPDTPMGMTNRSSNESMAGVISSRGDGSSVVMESTPPLPSPNPRIFDSMQWGRDTTWAATAGRALRSVCTNLLTIFSTHPITLCASESSPVPPFALWAASLLKSGVPTPSGWGEEATCTEGLPPPPCWLHSPP